MSLYPPYLQNVLKAFPSILLGIYLMTFTIVIHKDLARHNMDHVERSAFRYIICHVEPPNSKDLSALGMINIAKTTRNS